MNAPIFWNPHERRRVGYPMTSAIFWKPYDIPKAGYPMIASKFWIPHDDITGLQVVASSVSLPVTATAPRDSA